MASEVEVEVEVEPGAPELQRLGRLALPLIAGYAGSQVMGLVDIAMVGRLGKAELGGVGVGNALLFSVTMFAMGLVLGTEAPVSQAVGAGEVARARRVLWQGLRVALIAGLPAIMLTGLLPLVLRPAGISDAVAHQAELFVWWRLPGILPFLFFGACRTYLQSQNITRPIVIAMVVSNIVNVIGNLLFMYGDETFARLGLAPPGLPHLGIVGSALATVLASLCSLAIVARAVKAVTVPADPDRRRADPVLLRTILRLGSAVGGTMVAEIGVFALAGVLAGKMSDDAIAAHQVALTLSSFTFTVALGVGAATGVRVGNLIGQSDTAGARRVGFLGIGVGAAFMSLAALAFLIFPWPLARLMTDDPTVIAAAVPLLRIAAAFQVFDGIQAVCSGALRGAGDPVVPLVVNLFGYWVVGLPVAVVLGFTYELGAPGLWWGLTAGLVIAATALSTRFALLTRRPIQRV
jgi:MATE family multidrug resistance protein